MNNRTGNVYVQDKLAGKIEDTVEGYVFTYDANYLNSNNPLAISLTLPLSVEPYISKTLFPFFDGLIPEGWLLDLIIDNWKINPKDRFGLLMVACNDCIGDVIIREEQ